LIIDLRSDTVTLPTAPMVQAMMEARVGDDVFQEDPTVGHLEMKLAEMFGKEAGLFCPSGTMSNQIAIKVLTQPGDEIICHSEAHIYRYEGGGIAFNSQCSVRLLPGESGILDPPDIEININNPHDIHLPQTRLVAIEDTTNRGGGAYYSLGTIREIRSICKDRGLFFHVDGARVFNALAETKTDPAIYGDSFDTLSICLSKGLGAPVGSVLLGQKEHIKKARRIRKVLGGGMRQAGYLAAAGIYALDHHLDRLAEDHRRALEIGQVMACHPLVEDVFPIKTNLVIFRLKNPISETEFVGSLKEKGILAMAFGPSLVRMVTHLGIGDPMIDRMRLVL
jgi:threonine aldolase